MMVMELKAVVTDGAVQQLTVPYAIGSGIVEVFVHFGLQLRISQISSFVFLKSCFFSCSLVLGPLFRLSTYLMQYIETHFSTLNLIRQIYAARDGRDRLTGRKISIDHNKQNCKVQKCRKSNFMFEMRK